MKKIIVIIGVHLAIAFLIILLFCSGMTDTSALLEASKSHYLRWKAVVLFCRLLPALFASSFLISCASAFKKDAEKAVLPYSNVIAGHFKRIFPAALIMSFLIFAANELWVPKATAEISRIENEKILLEEFMNLGEKAYSEKKYLLAYEYGIQANQIDENNPDIHKLIDKAEALKGIERITKTEKRSDTVNDIYVRREAHGRSVAELIRAAERARAKENWFECHYLAELAVAVADSKDINVTDAKLMSAEAWKNLSIPAGLKFTEENDIFSDKKKAYDSLNMGNSLDAYYKFLRIKERLDGTADQDVDNFLSIARQRMLEQCFFIDETENLENFETSKDVYFSIKHPDETHDVVYIRGVTPIQNTGGLVQYLRDLNIIKFSKEGTIEQKMYVPYAKMTAQSVSVFSEDDKVRYDLRDEFEEIPMIMLRSVDRYASTNISEPVFEGKTVRDERDRNFVFLSIPFDDFSVICQAVRGEKYMNLTDLYTFAQKASTYGYSDEVFGSMLLYRLNMTFVVCFVLIFVALMAWNYRMAGEQLFKFKWIFILPLSSAIFFFVLEFLFAVVKLFDFALFGFSGIYSIFISLAIFAVLLFAVSLSFLRRTAE